MQCLLIFDHLNDIIYTKYNKLFEDHVNNFATKHGLISENATSGYNVNEDVIVQIFSPIITSHRIMKCQFGNSYTSVQCHEDLNIFFEDYMGYLFVSISKENVNFLKKFVAVSVTFVRYLCGPDVNQLKMVDNKADLLTNLLDGWTNLEKSEQSVFLEAIEQLSVNPELSSAAISILRESVEKLVPKIDCSKIHALILVGNRFLSLFSSQNAKELSPADILFCTILNQSCSTANNQIFSCQVLLSGPAPQPKCLPHVIHIIKLSEGVNLLYLLEIGNAAVAASLYETFCHLHTLQLVQVQRDKESLQPAFENFDLATKRLNDSLKKKPKSSGVENSHKQLMKKWDVIKKKYQEFLKTGSDEALLRAETLVLGFLENLKELLGLTSVDETVLKSSGKIVEEAGLGVSEKLIAYEEFLKVKSLKNFSLGSRDSLTIKKYLEEFPGLVHFMYVDRTSHRVTCPTIEAKTDEDLFTKHKIWTMVNFARNHLEEGTMSLIWKDAIFNYAYFLWFEDLSGAPLKPSISSTTNLPLPGILCQDFYLKLKEVCFPKMSANKIKCYELFCIHLGLVTASCVLEQTRRLSATIWELKGHPNHPIDLL